MTSVRSKLGIILTASIVAVATMGASGVQPDPDSLTADPAPASINAPTAGDNGTVYFPGSEVRVGVTGEVGANHGASAPNSETRPQATIYNVICTVQAHYAHKSEGAGGAIFKTTVNCAGHGLATVYVHVNGALFLDPASSVNDTSPINWQTRASSSQTRSIAVNGGTYTYYTPLPGSHGGYGTGFWMSSVNAQITAPARSAVDYASAIVFRSIR